jgi:predicted protein tyrosine phosphatase
MELILISHDEIDKLRGLGVTHALSLGDPGEPSTKPDWLPAANYLHVAFDDADFEDPLRPDIKGPTKEDTQRMLDFAIAAEKQGNAKLAILGDLGVSRSSAVYLIMLTRKLGVGNERRAVEQVFKEHGNTFPNRLILSYAREILAISTDLEALVNEVRGPLV